MEKLLCKCRLKVASFFKEGDYPCESYQFIAFIICCFPLLLQHVITEPFEPSPLVWINNLKKILIFPTNRQQHQQTDAERLCSLPKNEKKE